jgi:hypothetical protein
MTASWRVSRRTTLAWNASWRRSRSRLESAAAPGAETLGAETPITSRTTERVRGIDITGRLPGEFRVVASWRSASVSGREGSITYSATLDKSF